MSDNWARLNAIWTRRNVVVTAIVGTIAVGVPIFVYLDESKVREIPTETSESPKATKESPTVSVSSIHVSAVAMDVPAAFELEIKGSGVSNIPVQNMNVVLNFGKAEVESCGHSPKQLVTSVLGEDKSHRRYKIDKFGQNETLHIRCIISSPTFDQVVISGENLRSSHSIDFSHYQNFMSDTKMPFWTVWFYVVVSVISGILLLYFWIRLFEWF